MAPLMAPLATSRALSTTGLMTFLGTTFLTARFTLATAFLAVALTPVLFFLAVVLAAPRRAFGAALALRRDVALATVFRLAAAAGFAFALPRLAGLLDFFAFFFAIGVSPGMVRGRVPPRIRRCSSPTFAASAARVWAIAARISAGLSAMCQSSGRHVAGPRRSCVPIISSAARNATPPWQLPTKLWPTGGRRGMLPTGGPSP